MRQEIAHELLGASEAAAALGLSPYKAPLTLWLEKTGQLPAWEGNEHATWGIDVEPIVRQWYARELDVAVWIPPASLVSPEHPWMRGTPDGLVLASAEQEPDDPGNWVRGFEAKNTNWRSAHRWGEPGTDEIPIEYLIQAQQNLCVTELDTWHVVPSIGGAPPVVYEIQRDQELIDMIVEGGRRFMGYVADRVPPPIDHSEAWAEYVRTKYPWSTEDYIQAGPEDELILTEWRAVAAEIARLEKAEAGLKNRIAVAIGPASGMESSFGRVTYKPRRGGPAYKQAFESLAEVEGYDENERAAILDAHRNKDSRPLMAPRKWSSER